MDNADTKRIKSYCDNCQCYTNHYILYSHIVHGDHPQLSYLTKYFTIQCMGCEQVSFRREYHDHDTAYIDEFNDWVHDISVDLYPQPLKDHKPFKEKYLLPSQIQIVYNETLEALKCKCYLLAGVGFRSVIEAICIDKDILGRNLEQKINNLLKNRLITDKEADRLHGVRFLGNDSVHEMAVPREGTLYIVLEITEHLLSNLYIIDNRIKPLLDTLINTQNDFEELLLRNLKTFNNSDDFPLAKYLGKDMRRLNGQITLFENELINNIKSGKFTSLILGDLKLFGISNNGMVQHFIKS